MGFARITVRHAITATDGIVLSGANLWADSAGAFSVKLSTQVCGAAVITPFGRRITHTTRSPTADGRAGATHVVLADFAVITIALASARRLTCANVVHACAGRVGVTRVIIGHLVTTTDRVDVLGTCLRTLRADTCLICMTADSEELKVAVFVVLAGVSKSSTTPHWARAANRIFANFAGQTSLGVDASSRALTVGFDVGTSSAGQAGVAVSHTIATANGSVVFLASLHRELARPVAGNVAGVSAAQVTKIPERAGAGVVAGRWRLLSADTVDAITCAAFLGRRACDFACCVCRDAHPKSGCVTGGVIGLAVAAADWLVVIGAVFSESFALTCRSVCSALRRNRKITEETLGTLCAGRTATCRVDRDRVHNCIAIVVDSILNCVAVIVDAVIEGVAVLVNSVTEIIAHAVCIPSHKLADILSISGEAFISLSLVLGERLLCRSGIFGATHGQ